MLSPTAEVCRCCPGVWPWGPTFCMLCSNPTRSLGWLGQLFNESIELHKAAAGQRRPELEGALQQAKGSSFTGGVSGRGWTPPAAETWTAATEGLDEMPPSSHPLYGGSQRAITLALLPSRGGVYTPSSRTWWAPRPLGQSNAMGITRCQAHAQRGCQLPTQSPGAFALGARGCQARSLTILKLPYC